jgi:hypothetical protein
MADSVTLTYTLNMTGAEVLDTTDVPSGNATSDRQLTHNALNTSGQLSSSTSPDVEFAVTQEITISGTTTIDLTAAPKSASRTQDLTGKKLVSMIIEADANNSGNTTVAPGSANPYPLFGSGNSILVLPGETIGKTIRSGTATNHPAVSGTVKNIDVSGTASDVVKILMYFG